MVGPILGIWALIVGYSLIWVAYGKSTGESRSLGDAFLGKK